MALLMGLVLSPNVFAQYYWDLNAKKDGAGKTPDGTWNTTTANWDTLASGKSASEKFISGSSAIFSAGNDATGAYTVTVSGTQNVSSILIEDGNPTFTGGTINFNDSSPDLTINASHTLTFNSALTSSISGGLNLSGGGTLSLGSTTSLTGALNLGAILKLNSVNLTVGSLNLTSDSTIDFSGTSGTLNVGTLNLNGFSLSVINWTAAVDYFYATNWTGATQNVMGSAPMNLVTFNGFSATETGWDAYDNQIRPNVPEPSTYGALLLGSMTLLLVWRRRSVSSAAD